MLDWRIRAGRRNKSAGRRRRVTAMRESGRNAERRRRVEGGRS